MIEVTIPNYRLVQDVKPHYVYTIQVVSADHQLDRVEKRYSAFHAFHREVCIQYCDKAVVSLHFFSLVKEIDIYTTFSIKTYKMFTAQSPRTKKGWS